MTILADKHMQNGAAGPLLESPFHISAGASLKAGNNLSWDSFITPGFGE